nr:hypothetical protein [Tanacetum cinerariifolium]
ANGEGSCGLEWWRVVGCRESGREEQGNRGEGPMVPASVWGRVMEVVGEMGEWWGGAGNMGEWDNRGGGKTGLGMNSSLNRG